MTLCVPLKDACTDALLDIEPQQTNDFAASIFSLTLPQGKQKHGRMDPTTAASILTMQVSNKDNEIRKFSISVTKTRTTKTRRLFFSFYV